MSHARNQIRNALVTLLTGLATTGSRVFTSSVHALGENELPALRVFVDDEEIAAASIHNTVPLERSVLIRVECVSALNAGLDEDLDQIALEVEHAIAANTLLSGVLASPLLPTGITVDRSQDGAVQVGVLTLTYGTIYCVNNTAVDTPL